jgi:hypothetical protein
MDIKKLDRAKALEAEAAELREQAYAERPLPDFWRVGQKVRFLRSKEFAWNRDDVWEITRVADGTIPANQYQVFWTTPPSGLGTFWTTPDDVELVQNLEITFLNRGAMTMGMQIEAPLGACRLGVRVRKVSGSSWQGRIVGYYSTELTPFGYCVESEREPGSVQIYPMKALKIVTEN